MAKLPFRPLVSIAATSAMAENPCLGNGLRALRNFLHCSLAHVIGHSNNGCRPVRSGLPVVTQLGAAVGQAVRSSAVAAPVPGRTHIPDIPGRPPLSSRLHATCALDCWTARAVRVVAGSAHLFECAVVITNGQSQLLVDSSRGQSNCSSAASSDSSV